jgi:hypothetical protein
MMELHFSGMAGNQGEKEFTRLTPNGERRANDVPAS